MPRVQADARVAELVLLDVLDVARDGKLRLNDEFRDACIAAYEADPSCLGDVFQAFILARATAAGYAGVVDLDGLALVALEIAAGEAEERSPA